MAKLTLNDIPSGFFSNTAYNTNNNLIETALEKTLSRDGTSPNQMEVDLDMNSKSIINLATLDVESLVIDGVQVIPGGVVTSEIPSQVTHNGKFLQTNGTATSWQIPEAIEVSNLPAGAIIATTVQAAINELDTEKAKVTGDVANVFKVATAVANEDAVSLAQATTLFSSPAITNPTTTTTGSSTVYVLTPTNPLTSYITGTKYRVKFHITAGVTPTININSLGAKSLKLYNSVGTKVAASATSIITNLLTDIEYDGTDFVILDSLPGVVADSQVFTTTGAWTKPVNLTGNEVFLIEIFGSGGPGGNGGGGGGFGGAGGAGGGYKALRKLASELGATETVTVGAGGVAPSGTGGTTSFGSHINVLGGGPGDSYPSSPPAFGGVPAIVASQVGNTPAIGSVGGTAGADYESALGGTGALHSTTHGGGGGGCAAGGGSGGAGGVDGAPGVVGVVPGGGGGGGGATSGAGANGARGEIRVRLLAG